MASEWIRDPETGKIVRAPEPATSQMGKYVEDYDPESFGMPAGDPGTYERLASPDMSNYERWEDWGDVKHGIGQAFRPFYEMADYALPLEEIGQLAQGEDMSPYLMAGFIPGLKGGKTLTNILKKARKFAGTKPGKWGRRGIFWNEVFQPGGEDYSIGGTIRKQFFPTEAEKMIEEYTKKVETNEKKGGATNFNSDELQKRIDAGMSKEDAWNNMIDERYIDSTYKAINVPDSPEYDEDFDAYWKSQEF